MLLGLIIWDYWQHMALFLYVPYRDNTCVNTPIEWYIINPFLPSPGGIHWVFLPSTGGKENPVNPTWWGKEWIYDVQFYIGLFTQVLYLYSTYRNQAIYCQLCHIIRPSNTFAKYFLLIVHNIQCHLWSELETMFYLPMLWFH